MSYTKDVLLALLLIAPIALISAAPLVYAVNPVGSLTPTLEHFDTIGLTWTHDQINSTHITIERDDGSGFVLIANLTDITSTSFIDAKQLNLTRANVNSLKNAKGLDENSSYTYRVIVYNNTLPSSPTVSSSISTPISFLPFWELKEHDAEANTQKANMNVNTLGGSGDWLEIIDDGDAGRNAEFLMKIFNVTELGINGETDIILHLDSQCNVGTNCPISFRSALKAGAFNRYSSVLFPDGVNTGAGSAVNQTNQFAAVFNGASDSLQTGATTVFEPYTFRGSIDTKGLEDLGTDVFTFYLTFDATASNDAQIDIKNFTITNSTTWDFSNALLNFTQNASNCELQDGAGFILDGKEPSADNCDAGSVLASTTTHQEFIITENSTSDWQYRELQELDTRSGYALFDISSNSSGFIVETTNALTNNKPDELGNFWIFKTFTPTNATTTFSVTMSSDKNPSGSLTATLAAYELFGGQIENARWNNTLFESTVNQASTGLAPSTSSPLPPHSTQTVSVDIDTSSYIGTPITFSLEWRDNANLFDGKYLINEISIGGFSWNFSNAIIQREESNTNGDRGLISASSVVIPPSPTPDPVTSFTAVANLGDVDLSWVNGANTTDHTIDRGTFPISTANLKLDYTMDADSAVDPNNEQVGSASELQNSKLCGVGTCNYIIPSSMFGTTQVGYSFAGAGANTENSIRWGIDTNAGLAVNTTNISDWNFLNNDDWSITWFMYRDSESGKSTLLTSINDANTGSGTSGGRDRDGFTIVFDDNAQQAQIMTYSNDSLIGLNETSPTLFLEEDGTFHHYAITHDRSNFVKWYKDGVLIQTDSSIGTSVGSADIGLRIGSCWNNSACSDNTNGTFSGGSIEFPSRLDQMLIFNRVISDTEVSDIYNSGAGIAVEASFAQIASSTLIPPASYSDSFNIDNGWISKNNAIAFIDTSTGTINITDTLEREQDEMQALISFDVGEFLGITPNPDKFTIRTSMTYKVATSPVNVNYMVPIGVSEFNATSMGDGCSETGTGDFITGSESQQNALCLVFYDIGGDWRIVGHNSTDDANDNVDLTSTISVGTTVYPQLIVDYPYMRTTVFTDPTYTTVLNGGAVDKLTLLDSHVRLENFTNLWFGAGGFHLFNAVGQSHTINDVSFWNNINLTESTGTLATTWKDTDVDLGTVYQYRITPTNEVVGFSKSFGTSTLSNSVLTNDVPAQVQNLVSDYSGTHTIFSDWDSLPSSSGSGSPLGVGVTIQNHKIFIRDLGIPPFVLSGTGTTASDFTSTGVNFPDEKEIKVQACNQLGCGANSTIAQVLAFPLGTPILSATNNIINGINATWIPQQATGIIGYSLFNSSDNVTYDLMFTDSTNSTFFFFDFPHGVCYDQFYRLSAFTPTQNGTNATATGSTICQFFVTFNNLNLENVGDTFKVSGDFDFVGGNLTSYVLKENGVITDSNTNVINYTSIGTPTNVPFVFWERANLPTLTEFNVTVTGQDQNFGLDSTSGQVFGTREYNPVHFPAIVKPQGNVNYTLQRFNNDDSILLKVNREQVPSGETWQIECIYQDVLQALDTQDTIVPAIPTVDWIGTWDNTTDTGYFNSTISGVAGGHIYVSCFNDFLLFSTTSFTNSSLALFGIQAFDITFGEFLGLPVGVFFIILAAGMANKRTAPTWIVVLVGIAGIMSTIGFFTLEPIVWGLVLVTAMLGLLVNQKIF